MNECAAPELGPILRYKQFLFDRIPSLEEAFPDSSGVGSSDDRERRKLREFESHRQRQVTAMPIWVLCVVQNAPSYEYVYTALMIFKISKPNSLAYDLDNRS